MAAALDRRQTQARHATATLPRSLSRRVALVSAIWINKNHDDRAFHYDLREKTPTVSFDHRMLPTDTAERNCFTRVTLQEMFLHTQASEQMHQFRHALQLAQHARNR